MAKTVAETIRNITRKHLEADNGLLFGQCVTAVGWIGGTVPEMTEDEGIVELSMADVSGAGIAVGAAIVGRRPIYVIRYQGFMWYNSAPLLNYAAKSKEMWNVPCPILVRSIAMEGGIGPVASGGHHGMVMRMPGMPVCAPMTPGEWREIWDWFMSHETPLYVSEHRRSFPINYEMDNILNSEADITIIAISAARINAYKAIDYLNQDGIVCDLIHLLWLKPFQITETMINSITKTGLALVIDSDFEISSSSRSIAYELMHETSLPVHSLGLADRTAGFAPHLDNGTPTIEKIHGHIKSLVKKKNTQLPN